MASINEKLNYINETKSLIKDKLNDLGSEIGNETTFREYAEKIEDLYEEWPKINDEDTTINLENTKKGKMKCKLSPSELEQETTTGKNLVIDKIEQNAIDANGYLRSDTLNDMQVAQIEEGEIYTATTDDGQLVAGFFTSKPTANMSSYNNSRLVQASKTFTAPITGYVAFRTSTGYKYAQLEKGSSATDYEPYTGNQPAPNPQFPQNIYVISGDNTIKIENINLLNRITCEEDKILGWSTGTTTSNTDSLVSGYIHAKANDKFSFNYNTNIFFYNASKTYLGCLQSDGTSIGTTSGKSFTSITTPNNSSIAYMRLSFRSSNNNNTDMTSADIMVNRGDTLLNYIKHQEQSLLLNLGNLEYCKIGDYKDKFFKNLPTWDEYDENLEYGKWYLKKNINKLLLDGTNLTFNAYSSGDTENRWAYRTYTNAIPVCATSAGTNYSNYFKLGETSYLEPTTNGRLYLYFDKNLGFDVSNVTKLNNWLSTHNTSCYYPVSTPTYTLLNDTLQTQLNNIQKAMSYDTQTNISQTNNDLPFIINASALKKND